MYDYYVFSVGHWKVGDLQDALKDLGQSGWKLIAVANDVAYLRRKVA